MIPLAKVKSAKAKANSPKTSIVEVRATATLNARPPTLTMALMPTLR
jgi:hypothetical protein